MENSQDIVITVFGFRSTSNEGSVTLLPFPGPAGCTLGSPHGPLGISSEGLFEGFQEALKRL